MLGSQIYRFHVEDFKIKFSYVMAQTNLFNLYRMCLKMKKKISLNNGFAITANDKWAINCKIFK